MDFLRAVKNYGKEMPSGAPPISVSHPNYGKLGEISSRGFSPRRGKWASVNAIMRDHDRRVIKALRFGEDNLPAFAAAALFAQLHHDPNALPVVLGAITTYDGLIAARGNGAYQDIWMHLSTATGGVTTAWYDTWKQAWSPGAVPSVTNYANAGTGGAVMDATSNGSWITNPAGSNKKYVASCGVTVSSIAGFTLAMLYDCLWAGNYSLAATGTFNPSSDIAVTRYTGTASAGNMMQCTVSTNYTATTGMTVTTSFTNSAGTTAQSTVSLFGTTSLNIPRVVGNTLYNSATVVTSSPFMPLNGSNGVQNLEQVVLSVGATTAGACDHKIVRPLMLMPFIAANSYIEQDATLNIGNMVELVNASQVCGCIGWNVFTGNTTTATMSSMLRLVEG